MASYCQTNKIELYDEFRKFDKNVIKLFIIIFSPFTIYLLIFSKDTGKLNFEEFKIALKNVNMWYFDSKQDILMFKTKFEVETDLVSIKLFM